VGTHWRMRAMCSDGSGGWTESGDLDETVMACVSGEAFTWLEVDLRAERELATQVVERLELDPLAVEDAFSMRQRPKLESYDEHQFLVLFQLDEEDEQLEPRQVAVSTDQSYVVILHDGAGRTLDEARGRVHKVAPGELDVERAVHALLDTVVDDYERISGRLDVDIEDLEAKALQASRRGVREPAETAEHLPSQELLYSIKQQVSALRRYALPLTGVVTTFQHEEERRRRAAGDDDRTNFLFRDVADHVIRLEAQVRNIDDLAGAVVDLTRSLQADLLNEVNKKLSAWAAIIAIPTLIASIYGTNYKLWPPPDESRSWGFLGVVLIMAVAGAALWMFFKRKRWI